MIFIIFIPCIKAQNYEIGQKFNNSDPNFTLLGVSSKDNSKIYRYKQSFPTTVFSYNVAYFEIKAYNNKIVNLHFVLNPKDRSTSVPKDLIDKVKSKSGVMPVLKNNKYYFDDDISRTMIFRENKLEYGGDKIHVMVVSIDYLSK